MLRLFILSAIVFTCAALPLTSSNPASLHLLQSPSARCLDATQAGYATAPFLHYIFVTFGQLLPPPRGIHQLNLGIQPRRRRRVCVPARLHKSRQNASRQQQIVAAHHRVGAGTACFSQLYSSSLFATAVSVHRPSMESSALQRASRVREVLHGRSVHWRRF